jgi:hypothetical protein
LISDDECEQCDCQEFYYLRYCRQCDCRYFIGQGNYCNDICRSLGTKKQELVRLLRTFGSTIEEYEALMLEQDNCCAICHEPEKQILNGKIKRLAIDHCHTTGKVRGLLCQRCNTGIGRFDDNVALLKQAIQYLEKFGVTQ